MEIKESVYVDIQLNYLRLQLISHRKTYDDVSLKAALIIAIPHHYKNLWNK